MSRTITTAAELDALPFPNAVTFPGYGDWHKRRDGRWLCDDGDVLASGALALVANGELTLTGDPSSPAPAPSVVPEAAVEAATAAVRRERAFAAAAAFGVPLDAVPECAEMIARAALAAALPFLTAAPSATREEVARTWHEAAPESGPGAWDRASDRVRERSLPRADALLARFNITPKETDHA